MDRKLFSVLKIIDERFKTTGYAVFNCNDEDACDSSDGFDDFVLAAIQLAKSGYVEFDYSSKSGNIRRNFSGAGRQFLGLIVKQMTYQGRVVGGYSSFDEYMQAEAVSHSPASVVYNTTNINAPVQGGAFNINSAHSHATVRSDSSSSNLEEMLGLLRTLIEKESSLSEAEKKDALVDTDALKGQLQKSNPSIRTFSVVLDGLENNLGKISKIVGVINKIRELLPLSFLGA